jgi:hypothetical protein
MLDFLRDVAADVIAGLILSSPFIIRWLKKKNHKNRHLKKTLIYNK